VSKKRGSDARLVLSSDPRRAADRTNWTKRGPIINGSFGCGGHCNATAPGDRGKDPSAAWQNPSGEWQFVTGDVPIVYGSMDFKEWYYIGLGFTNGGKAPQGGGGDCPSFFKLPPTTPGAGPAPNASAPPPTHVHMVAGGWMTLGWYTPGPPKTVGEFLEADPSTHRKSDTGLYDSLYKNFSRICFSLLPSAPIYRSTVATCVCPAP